MKKYFKLKAVKALLKKLNKVAKFKFYYCIIIVEFIFIWR